MMRKYQTGMSWAVWRWTFTPSKYLKRLHILKTPWFAIMVHWIMKPDPEQDLHNHPVNFIAFVLRGGYCELREDGNIYPRQVYNLVRHTTFHRITHVLPNTMSLAINGRAQHEWGYKTSAGFVSWKQYPQCNT